MPLADDLHKGQLLPLKLRFIVPLKKEKVLVGGIKNGYFTVHNLMCVCDNKALLCLTENFIQPYNGNKSAFDKIAEHITRTYGGELVGVAYKNKSASCGKRSHNAFHNECVHH